MASKSTTNIARRVGNFSLWFGMLGAPVAWSLHTLLSYYLLYVVCGTAWTFLLYAVTVVAVLVAAGAGYASWHTWHDQAPARDPDVVRMRSVSRRRFMGITGLFISALFGFITLVVGLTPIILDTCP